jgi:hypothetical protein
MGCRRSKKIKQFFFEKKNQKTFAPLRAYVPPAGGTSHAQSFFCVFFVHKKEDFLHPLRPQSSSSFA